MAWDCPGYLFNRKADIPTKSHRQYLWQQLGKMDHQHELLNYGITDNENAYMPLTTVFAAFVQCCIVWGSVLWILTFCPERKTKRYAIKNKIQQVRVTVNMCHYSKRLTNFTCIQSEEGIDQLHRFIRFTKTPYLKPQIYDMI